MTKLKTLGLIGASALALTATAASAQYRQYDQHGQYDPYGQSGQYDRNDFRDAPRGNTDVRGMAYIDRVEWRIRQAEQSGRISPRQAAYLLAQLRDVRQIAWRYNRDGGLNRWEHADLNRRLNELQKPLRGHGRDGNRDYGYGYGPDWRR
jgi:hypothetical protein